MHGPFFLNAASIDEVVKNGRIGVYVLGNLYGNTFVAKYVGRSDTDVKRRLKEHLGEYWYFWFEYSLDVTQAYVRECEFYHYYNRFGFLDNKINPDNP